MNAEHAHPLPSDPWELRTPPGDTNSGDGRARGVTSRRGDRSGWHWLLVAPIVAALLSPYYNRVAPEFGGMPFFYWFPLSLNLVAGACMLTVHLATKRGR